MTAALDGVRVIDLSRLLPGPYLTQILADLGAEVIKVEQPGRGDPQRQVAPLVGSCGGAFAAINRGKKSVTVDLADPTGAAEVLRLCEQADVLVESFRPGVMERWGLGPDVVRGRQPRLIYCRVSGYGQTGPDASRAGHDINYAARAGLVGLATPVAVIPLPIADLVGGSLYPAIAILAALRQRDRTGEGTTIDAAIVDGAWSLMILSLSKYLAAPAARDLCDDLVIGGAPCYGVYATRDGALAVGAFGDKFWGRLCDAIGRLDLKPHGLVSGEAGRAIREQLRAIFAQRTTAEWQALLDPLDCCVEPVQDPRRTHLEDATLARHELTANVDVDGQAVQVPLTPLVVGTDCRQRRGPPQLGQHNRELLGR